MPPINRKTATKVFDGKVERKNRCDLSGSFGYTILKKPAGKGFTHVVSPAQLTSFIELIPDWPALSRGLLAIELTHGDLDLFGYHAKYQRLRATVIALCAWNKDLWSPVSLTFYREHKTILESLGVSSSVKLTEAVCRFSVAQARAFTLLHVFMHEVGHHHDWQRRRGSSLPGKEDYAEHFATHYFPILLPRYIERFGKLQ